MTLGPLLPDQIREPSVPGAARLSSGAHCAVALAPSWRTNWHFQAVSRGCSSLLLCFLFCAVLLFLLLNGAKTQALQGP